MWTEHRRLPHTGASWRVSWEPAPSSYGPPVLLGVIAIAEYDLPWRQPSRIVTVLAALLLTAGFVSQSLQHVRLAARVRAVLKTRSLEQG